MKRPIQLPFIKLHGLGNDFIVSDSSKWNDEARKGVRGRRGKTSSDNFLRNLASAICERHTGVGADGFLLVEPPKHRGDHARVRFFNADGSEAEMSGNGIRCVGAFLRESGKSNNPLRIETLAGLKTLEAVAGGAGEWQFHVIMGHPILEPAEIPFAAKGVSAPVAGYTLTTKLGRYRVTVTSMGNPHCSLFVKDFDQIDWTAIGRTIEIHPLFPNRTNVEFVKVISQREIEVRYWERGVGITASSGTGSCAAVVASILNGYTGRRVRVQTLAGALQIEWRKDGVVLLTGPARSIAQGVYFRG